MHQSYAKPRFRRSEKHQDRNLACAGRTIFLLNLDQLECLSTSPNRTANYLEVIPALESVKLKGCQVKAMGVTKKSIWSDSNMGTKIAEM